LAYFVRIELRVRNVTVDILWMEYSFRNCWRCITDIISYRSPGSHMGFVAY